MSDTARPEPAPFQRFTEAMKKIIAIPKSEVLKREQEYKERRKQVREKKKTT